MRRSLHLSSFLLFASSIMFRFHFCIGESSTTSPFLFPKPRAAVFSCHHKPFFVIIRHQKKSQKGKKEKKRKKNEKKCEKGLKKGGDRVN